MRRILRSTSAEIGQVRAPSLEELGLAHMNETGRVGLRDDVLRGFYQNETGEVYSGVPITADDIVVDVYNSRINLAGKHTWDPITVTVRDDVTGKVAKTIAAQMQKQVDHANQASTKSGSGYKFDMWIENLDGNSDGPVVLDAWHLGGCYVQNVNYGENNYATSDPLQITIAIKYDNANHHDVGGADSPGAPMMEGGLGDATDPASKNGG